MRSVVQLSQIDEVKADSNWLGWLPFWRRSARICWQDRIIGKEGMNMLNAFIGGICIGLGAMLLMLVNGRIAGVSGLLYRSFNDPRRHYWALLFLAGLCLGAVIHLGISGQPAPIFAQSLSTLLPAEIGRASCRERV